MAPAATVGRNSGDVGHERAREVGERKRRGKGFDSMPYPQHRSTEATGIRPARGGVDLFCSCASSYFGGAGLGVAQG
jgi:hypothetical protein